MCTSGSVVEYRLAKARVAGSNPVSCSQRDRKKGHPMDGSFFYVRSLPGSNGSNVSAPVVAGERPPDVLRRLVLSMIQKRGIRWGSLFLYIQVLPGSNGSNVCVPLRSSQQFQMLVKRRIAWYDKICSEMLAECISRNCRQYTIEFMHEGHTLKKV